MFTIQGQKISLQEVIGDVIILRFSRFSPQDLPYLIYLDHLYGLYKKEGLHLFFINVLGNYYSESINKSTEFSAPIIDDDGYISAVFQARLKDVVLIGRDFEIKLKHNQISNRTIYNQTVRYLYENSVPPDYYSKRDLGSLIKRITYRNVENGKLENIGLLIKNKFALINLFISTCLGCPENRKILLMKDISNEINAKNGIIILLFGRGNDFNLIKKYSKNNDFFKNNITVGIIQELEELSIDDYYRIFQLDIDPRMSIFNKKGEIIFLEDLKNQKKINLDFLAGKIE